MEMISLDTLLVLISLPSALSLATKPVRSVVSWRKRRARAAEAVLDFHLLRVTMAHVHSKII